MRSRVTALAAAALVAVAGMAACTPPGGPYPHEEDAGGYEDAPSRTGFATLAEVEAQEVRWSSCGNGAECAEILVPLDYADVPGRAVRIALKRLPATGESQGSIVVNPGGPGEPGTELVDAAPAIFGSAVLQHHDVVGFDPRGVGASTQVRCLEAGEDDPTGYAYDLDDPGSLKQLRTDHAMLGRRCTELSGDLLQHVDTAHSARDLDVIRAVLGEDALTYVGYSYGTLLGAVYAETFPDRVGRLVLDSAVDPGLGYADLQTQQLEGFEEVFAAFVEQCHTGAPAATGGADGAGSGCPLPEDPDAASAELVELVAELDADPLPSDSEDGELAGWELLSAVTGAMYYSPDWPLLVEGLADVEAGTDGSTVDRINELGVTAGSSDPNDPFAYPAIDCTDYPMTSTFEEAVAHARELEAASPLFGPGSIAELACVLWPAAASVERVPIAAEGAPPILVVSALRDPATPHAWSVSLAEQLSSGTLLSWDGEGHGIYGGISSCVDAAVDDYLLTGALPAAGTVCED